MSERSTHSTRRTTARRRATTIAVGLLAVTSLGMAACSSDDDSGSADSDSTTTESTMADSGMDETTTTMAESMAMEPTGPACASVPAEGAGSFTGMAEAPAATAASNNPELSTLVAAVTEAGLVDTLNGEGPFTIFAPANSAFAKIPEADLNAADAIAGAEDSPGGTITVRSAAVAVPPRGHVTIRAARCPKGCDLLDKSVRLAGAPTIRVLCGIGGREFIAQLDPRRVIQSLQDHGVVYGLQTEALRTALTSGHCEHLVVAVGCPAGHGERTRFVNLVEDRMADARGDSSELARVDYRAMGHLHLVDRGVQLMHT